MPELPERAPEGAERWVIAIFTAGFAGMMGVSLFEDYEPRKLGVVFVLLFWMPLLVIHEAGHAIVARLCGWEVERVVIGYGRTRRTWVIGGVPVLFKTLPLSGYVLPRPRDLQSPQLKNALIYAGGPAFELAAALLVLAVSGPEVLFQPSIDVPVIAAQSFCLAAALGLVFTLVPHTVSTERGESWSDGMGILMSWRIPESDFARWIRDSKEEPDEPPETPS